MKLVKTNKADYPFLYELLKRRDKKENITHSKIPSYRDHCRFNASRPYQEDYIVWNNNQRVGRVYIRRKEKIGIQKTVEKIGIKTIDKSDESVLKLFKHRHLEAEVNPKNKRFIKILKKQGYRLIHYTYDNSQKCS